MKRPKLIIIPGLGDRGWLYTWNKFLWHLLGFDVEIFVFGWNNQLTYEAKLKRLLAVIDSTPTPIYIIGVSAGGTAAITALYKRPEKIQCVATIATPYSAVPHLNNDTLSTAQRNAEMILNRLEPEQKQRIVCIYGLYDEKIPTLRRRLMGIRQSQIFIIGHGPIIFFALTFYSLKMRNLLIKRN